MDVNSVKTSEQNESFLFINEAVISLEKAVSTLNSMNVFDKAVNSEKSDINFPKEGLDFYLAIKNYEINLIKQALQITRGNQTKAAKLLKLNLSTLNGIIKRHNINF